MQECLFCVPSLLQPSSSVVALYLLRLLYPLKHYLFSLFPYNLCPNFPKLLFKVICLRGLFMSSALSKLCLILPCQRWAQQQVVFMFVDVLFPCCIGTPAYFINFSFISFYHGNGRTHAAFGQFSNDMKPMTGLLGDILDINAFSVLPVSKPFKASLFSSPTYRIWPFFRSTIVLCPFPDRKLVLCRYCPLFKDGGA